MLILPASIEAQEFILAFLTICIIILCPSVYMLKKGWGGRRSHLLVTINSPHSLLPHLSLQDERL